MMVIGMTFSMYSKNSACLLSALLLVACQPPAPNNEHPAVDNSKTTDTPLIIKADSVIMTTEYILNIKPSRYQPSLGLQGTIEPIKQKQLIAADALSIEQVLVTEGQWVEKGRPLLIVRRQVATAQQTNQNAINDNTAASEPLSDSQQDPKTVNSPTANITNKAASLKTDVPLTVKSSDLKSNSKPSSATADGIVAKTSNSPSLDVADDGSSLVYTTKDAIDSEKPFQLITVRASFSGRVNNLYAQVGQQLADRAPLLQLSDDTKLRFIATLPIQAEPQLSVGQTVNFTAQGLSEKFTGQVSKLVVSDNQLDQLLVYVDVVKNNASRNTLKPDMSVTGRVNYGQIEVGAIVPERALHDVDLTILQKPPYQSVSTLTANVWTIKQDQHLTRQPVEVISYDPNTGQYLIAGISHDSLICLADLPIESAGKKVVIS